MFGRTLRSEPFTPSSIPHQEDGMAIIMWQSFPKNCPRMYLGKCTAITPNCSANNSKDELIEVELKNCFIFQSMVWLNKIEDNTEFVFTTLVQPPYHRWYGKAFLANLWYRNVMASAKNLCKIISRKCFSFGKNIFYFFIIQCFFSGRNSNNLY